MPRFDDIKRRLAEGGNYSGDHAAYDDLSWCVGVIEESERQLTDALVRLDHREDQIGNILSEMGSDAEWSNLCDLGDHGVEVAAGLVGIIKRLRLLMLEAVENCEQDRGESICSLTRCARCRSFYYELPCAESGQEPDTGKEA